MMRESPRPEFHLSLLDGDAPDDLIANYRAEGIQAFNRSRRFRRGKCVGLSLLNHQWIGRDEAKVGVDYYYAPLGAISGTLRLRKNKEEWKIVGWDLGPVA